MQTIVIAYDDGTHAITADNGYAGATIDNSSTEIRVTGTPEGYEVRLEFDVVVRDNNGMNRKPFVILEEVPGEDYLSCTVPDTILNACTRTHKLPTQVVLYDSENGIVTASKNILILNVAPSVDAFGAFVSAYVDKWTRAIIKIEQDSETGYIVVTDMEGNERTVQFDLSVLRLPATNIEGIIPVSNLPPSATGEVVEVDTESDRLALDAEDVQNGDVVYVAQSQLMYVVKDETALGTEAAWQVYRAKVSWGDVEGQISNQTDLRDAFAAVANVQPDWSEADATADDFIKNKPSLGTASALNAGTQPGNVPVLNADGQISPSQIPELAISRPLGTVSEKADLVNLSAGQTGDWAFVLEDDDPANNGMYILGGTYSVLADWKHVETSAQVFSVDGETGTVDLRSLGYTKVFFDGNDPYGLIEGDGESTEFEIYHGLGTIPLVDIYDAEGLRTTATIEATASTITVTFYSAPEEGEDFKVVIHA